MIIRRPAQCSLDHDRDLVGRGQHHDPGELVKLPEPGDQLQALDIGQAQVEQDDLRAEAPGDIDRRGSVKSARQLVLR